MLMNQNFGSSTSRSKLERLPTEPTTEPNENIPPRLLMKTSRLDEKDKMQGYFKKNELKKTFYSMVKNES